MPAGQHPLLRPLVVKTRLLVVDEGRAMSDENRAIRATWIHNGREECVVVVDENLKWRSPLEETDRFGIWKYGRSVVAIDPSGRVFLDPSERPDGWANVIQCSNTFSVEHDDSSEGILMARKSLRSQLYRAARDLGNVEAAEEGPVSYGQQVARQKVYRKTNTGLGSIPRGLGISGKRR